jgi:hypothetical protein
MRENVIGLNLGMLGPLQANAASEAGLPAITDLSRKPTGEIALDNPCTSPLVACFQTRS